MDKPYNTVFTEDGTSFVLMEHSWGDGMTGAYLRHVSAREIRDHPSVGPHTRPVCNTAAITRLG